MGGISATVSTDHPAAAIANPGQLGIATLNNYVALNMYVPKTKWLPPFGMDDLTYNVTSFNVGLSFDKVVPVPLPVSVGIGYSRIYLNLGTFNITINDPNVIATFQAYEKAENISLGVGFDYWVKVGAGITVKNIVSSLGPAAPDTIVIPGKASATDVGIILRIPLVDVLGRLRGEQVSLTGVKPLFDLTTGYARSNVGSEISYSNPNRRGPLPRKATLGLSWEAGLVLNDWKLLSFTWAREADDLLVTRPASGGFEYQRGLGDLQFFKNIILGEWNERVFLRKGWQFNLAEVLYVRGGSVIAPGRLIYSTTGLGLRLSGVIKFIESIDPSFFEGSVASYILDHMDVRYDQSSYASAESPVAGTEFKGLTLIIK